MTAAGFHVRWSSTAAADLLAIIDFILAQDPLGAQDVLDDLKRRAATLTTSPMRGRIVPELQRHGVYRYREIQRPPWRILYRIDARAVYILAVIDGRRNVEDLLLDRLLREQ